jgi:pimeloyl-ACP methyl ester carboxylesterase
LYNPLAIQEVEVQGQSVPLETDLTTPQAYCLANTDLKEVGVVGFLRAEKVERKAGIYLFEPYQPGKIPVLMIHGLLSSPLTWMPLFNDLRADPVLRERFQFWFYLYPTGNPYLVTAAELRDSLAQLRADLDPDHRDAALDQMVLVGHSMGGLVARLLTVDSGYAFFEQVSQEPLEQLKAKDEVKEELARIFFFQPQPFVKRVIFLGTPHRGSRLSPSWPARLAVRFVRLPNRLMEIGKDLAADNPALWKSGSAANLPTSVDLLAPGAPALVLLSHLPRPIDVHYHSIIGVVPPKEAWVAALLAGNDDKKGSDGIVPYTSAHLDDADSELVIGADHASVHRHPLAALEVRRILLEHLHSLQTAPATTR